MGSRYWSEVLCFDSARSNFQVAAVLPRPQLHEYSTVFICNCITMYYHVVMNIMDDLGGINQQERWSAWYWEPRGSKAIVQLVDRSTWHFHVAAELPGG